MLSDARTTDAPREFDFRSGVEKPASPQSCLQLGQGIIEDGFGSEGLSTLNWENRENLKSLPITRHPFPFRSHDTLQCESCLEGAAIFLSYLGRRTWIFCAYPPVSNQIFGLTLTTYRSTRVGLLSVPPPLSLIACLSFVPSHIHNFYRSPVCSNDVTRNKYSVRTWRAFF